MRKKISPLPGLVAVTGCLLLLPGCLKDHVTETYKILTPVYELKSTVVANMNGDPGTTINQTGQIYVKGSYIYLNDVNRGIHVINNSDPSHPVQTAFLAIPGNQNIGIRNNILYADMYADVLAIDISNIHQVKVVGWLESFFTNRMFGGDSSEIVAKWNEKDTSVTVTPPGLVMVPHSNYLTNPGYFAAASDMVANSTAAASTGTAGSNAVMTLVGDYLYAIPEEHSLGIVHVADSTNPTQVSWTPPGLAGYDLETIFAIQDKLLLGSKEGVYVYSIDNPAQPTQVGQFTHGTACDPVIANSNYAYVTLHSGTECGGAANELDILDAKEISNATMIKSYPMTSPTGLCLDGTLLFVCDQSVVKVFDASKPDYLQLLSTASVNQPSDVIAINHVMIVVGLDGLYQFDYSDPSHVTALSTLPINISKQ